MIVKVRVLQLGGHDHLTFWTGQKGFTLANAGTLVMRVEETDEFLSMMDLSRETELEVDDRRPKQPDPAWQAAIQVRRTG